MLSDESSCSGLHGVRGMTDDLVAYPPELGKQLARLRNRCGFTPEEAASRVGVSTEALKSYEEATWRPSLTRMARLTALYGASLIDFLQDVAASVRPRDDTPLPFAVTALLLFNGVSPEQVAEGRAAPVDDPAVTVDEPLGEVLRYRRDDDPVRVRGGLLLKREYEAGASIRTLSEKHRLAFGTVRTLLVEANTRLRGRGGAQSSGR